MVVRGETGVFEGPARRRVGAPHISSCPDNGGGAGPVGGLLGGKDPTGQLLDSRLPATPGLRNRIEQVVVAGRGVGGGDHREHVRGEQPEADFASPALFAYPPKSMVPNTSSLLVEAWLPVMSVYRALTRLLLKM